jgi:tRNA modification GTPase
MSDPQHQEHPHRGPAPVWTVRNKIDLDPAAAEAKERARRPRDRKNGDFWISASRGDGIGELMAGLVAYAQDYFGSDDGGLIGRERQRALLHQTAAALQRGIAAAGEGEELVAEELRAAAFSLGRLLGRVDVEDVLDAIFRDFCIGK